MQERHPPKAVSHRVFQEMTGRPVQELLGADECPECGHTGYVIVGEFPQVKRVAVEGE